MKLHPLHSNRVLRRLLALAAVATMALGALAPKPATAAEYVAYVQDEASTNIIGYYTSYVDAIKTGFVDGRVIVMLADWDLDCTLETPDDSKVTIDMQGHIIKHGPASEYDPVSIIRVGERATLTIKSNVNKTITYKYYRSQDNSDIADATTMTGGLITNGIIEAGLPDAPIEMHSSSTLNLEHVTVGGCTSEPTGAVRMRAGCTLNMTKGASIEHTRGTTGGAVDAQGQNIAINMDNASISDNISNLYGGGIYAENKGIRIKMTDSKISGNSSGAGGGIYFKTVDFELASSDKSGVVSDNRSTSSSRSTTKGLQSGGGIHVDQTQSETNKGLIEGITIRGNYSAYDGGGIELDQENTTLRNCTITGNTCKYEGGGVYVCNDDNTIDGCTITGNACNVNDDGKNYEGGGVFVWHSYDIELKGVCVIKDNTRGKGSGNADDVMLRENGGASAKAYITGTLESGSSVGVRTGYTSDRMVAKNFKPQTNDCLFADLDGYFVTYGSDHDGDAWQRKGTKTFSLKVDGAEQGRYAQGSTVTATAKPEPGKFFVRWDTGKAEGLNPVGDYIADSNLYSSSLSFKMP